MAEVTFTQTLDKGITFRSLASWDRGRQADLPDFQNTIVKDPTFVVDLNFGGRGNAINNVDRVRADRYWNGIVIPSDLSARLRLGQVKGETSLIEPGNDEVGRGSLGGRSLDGTRIRATSKTKVGMNVASSPPFATWASPFRSRTETTAIVAVQRFPLLFSKERD